MRDPPSRARKVRGGGRTVSYAVEDEVRQREEAETSRNHLGSGTARRPQSWMRRRAQGHAASSCSSTHEHLRTGIRRRRRQPPWVGHCPTPAILDAPPCPGTRRVELQLDPRTPSHRDSSAPETTPVGRALPDARDPGCAAVPRDTPRRAMARPTNTFAPGFVGAGDNPRGSGTARRSRSWMRRRAQGHAASSYGSTHEHLRRWIRRRRRQPPVGRAPPDARVPGCAAVPRDTPRRAVARPTNTFAPGFVGAGNNPRGSGTARRSSRQDHPDDHVQRPHRRGAPRTNRIAPSSLASSGAAWPAWAIR